MKKNKFLLVIRYLISVMLIYAGVYKLLDVNLFISQMNQSPLIPSTLTPFIAFFLPISEIFLGGFLIFKVNKDILGVIFSLMLFFTIYLVALFTLYSNPPCACGGILSKMDYPEHIAFNVLFTILALILLINENKISSSDNDTIDFRL